MKIKLVHCGGGKILFLNEEVEEYGLQTDIYRPSKYGRGKIITTIKSMLTFPFDTMHFSSMVFTLQPHGLRVLAGEILSLAMVRRLWRLAR